MMSGKSKYRAGHVGRPQTTCGLVRLSLQDERKSKDWHHEAARPGHGRFVGQVIDLPSWLFQQGVVKPGALWVFLSIVAAPVLGVMACRNEA